MTLTGAVLGSPGYMAPEQAAGRPTAVGPPADVWGLGAILYRLVAGEPPFRGASVYDTIQLTIAAEVVSPRAKNAQVPWDLETIVLKCLEKDPWRRYPSAAALGDDLTRFVQGRPILARRTGRLRRLVMWVRRNRVVAALLTAVFVSLAAGTGVSIWQAVRAKRQADLARVSGHTVDVQFASQAAALMLHNNARDFEITRADVEQQMGVAPELRYHALRYLDFHQSAAGMGFRASETNGAAWRIVSQPGHKPASYRRACLWVEDVLIDLPDEPGLLNTLGVGQYRLGLFNPAIAALARSEAGRLAQKLEGVSGTELASLFSVALPS